MEDFNNILNNKIKNYQESPPPELFDKIKNQYPQRTVLETINYNKYYIIAAITSILLIGYLITNPSNNDTQYTKATITQNSFIINAHEKTPQIDVESTSVEIAVISNNDNKDYEEPILTNSNSITSKHINIFSKKDTSICGNTIELQDILNLDYITIPSKIKLTTEPHSTSVVASEYGSYTIFYKQVENRIQYIDSMTITFNSNPNPEVHISKDRLCPGEDILIEIKTANTQTNWMIENAKITSINNELYKITDIRDNFEQIEILFTNNQNCNYIYRKDISVIENLKYNYVSTPNFCGGSNAGLNITNLNHSVSEYILNNELVSYNGEFDNLRSGIYFLRLEYGDECYSYDTLLIKDSLKISPYFKSEKDLVNTNKYSFRNLTDIDNNSYAQNANIEFVWKINGVEQSTKDNPEYEFTSNGEYSVELLARIGNNCISTYSETILISESNFLIPNIFTPNGDGIGDYFKIIYEGELINYNIKIINKTGEIVYKNTNISNHWDGKINGNDFASEGLYYYIIQGENKYGKNIEQKGTLQLVRN